MLSTYRYKSRRIPALQEETKQFFAGSRAVGKPFCKVYEQDSESLGGTTAKVVYGASIILELVIHLHGVIYPHSYYTVM
jgi:hypothetical protein